MEWYPSIEHISGSPTSQPLGSFFVWRSEMAVAGVKNVEIPRVANLSPERFHRSEKKDEKYQIWRRNCSSVSCPGSSSQKQDLLSSQMQLKIGRVDSGPLRYRLTLSCFALYCPVLPCITLYCLVLTCIV